MRLLILCFTTGSSEVEGRPDTGAESGSWLFLQLLGGEINEDLDSSEEEVEEGDKQEEEEAGEKEEEEEEKERKEEEKERKEEEMDTEKGGSSDGENKVILSVNHDAEASHESEEDSSKFSCQNSVRKSGGSRIPSNAKIKQTSSATDSSNAKHEQSPPEISTSSPTNCNKRKDTSQDSTFSCADVESCPTSGNFDDSVKAPPTNDVTSKSDSDPSGGSTTKGRRLLDLLTSSVEDRSPKTPILETHEELTSCKASTERNQSAVMEVCVCFIF